MNGASRTVALVALALSATPCLAQSSPPSQNFLTELPPGGLPATRLIGVDVVGMDRERVGRTEDVILDAAGRAQAVVIGVGGFLGIGEKRVAVPFDQISWNLGEGSGPAAPPLSGAVSANAPSAETAATSGPSTMPGAQVSNDVLASIDEKRGGAVNDATGSVAAQDQSRGRATVPTAGSGSDPVRAEIRLTKAALQAAPPYRP